MAGAEFDLDEVVEVTVRTTLLPPTSLGEMSPQGAFLAALYSFLQTLQDLPWAEIELADRLYAAITNDPTFTDLLARFPAETTLEQLIERVQELVWEHWGVVVSLTHEEYFNQRLVELITVLYWFRTYDAEVEALDALRTELGKVPETIHIGEVEVETPVRDQFQTFLDLMEVRHQSLYDLAQKYFGASESEGGSSLGEQLGDGLEWAWRQWVGFAEALGATSSEEIEAVRGQIGSIQYPPEWDVFKVQFAETVLVPLYNVTQLGVRYRAALEGGPATAISALAGTAVGMAGEMAGVFLIVDLAAMAGVPVNDLTDPLGDLVNQGLNAIGLDPDAFQTGVEMGRFGMGVSEAIVGIKAASSATLDTATAVTKPGWLGQLGQSGSGAISAGGGVEALVWVAEEAEVIGTVVVTRRHLLLVQSAFAMAGGTSGSSSGGNGGDDEILPENTREQIDELFEDEFHSNLEMGHCEDTAQALSDILDEFNPEILQVESSFPGPALIAKGPNGEQIQMAIDVANYSPYHKIVRFTTPDGVFYTDGLVHRWFGATGVSWETYTNLWMYPQDMIIVP